MMRKVAGCIVCGGDLEPLRGEQGRWVCTSCGNKFAARHDD